MAGQTITDEAALRLGIVDPRSYQHEARGKRRPRETRQAYCSPRSACPGGGDVELVVQCPHVIDPLSAQARRRSGGIPRPLAHGMRHTAEALASRYAARKGLLDRQSSGQRVLSGEVASHVRHLVQRYAGRERSPPRA
jgi:hypothetical protein